MKRERLYRALLAAWVLLLLALTSVPNPRFGVSFRGADKLAHFGFYGGAGMLFVLWRRAAGQGAAVSVGAAMVFAALLGAADELHQLWIPGRSMNLVDWFADFAGGTAGAVVSLPAASWFPSLLPPENQSPPRPLTD